MPKLDGYLSNKIQQIYQRAKVLVSDDGDFVLQRDNEPDLELGKSFKEARASIFAIRFIPPQDAWNLHQDFKWKFIAPLPEYGDIIKVEDVLAWIKEKFNEETKGENS